jgi:hypothetical protein
VIPFGPGRPDCPPRPTDTTSSDANPLLARLDPADGQRLLALHCQLIWATSWMADANEIIAPRLGLPDLPLVAWPDTEESHPYVHWKTSGIVAWAAGRSFVWIDDEITDADRASVSAHHPRAALLHRIDPACGLTAADFSTIRDWISDRSR